MKKNIQYRLAIVLAVTVVFAGLFWYDGINLGLDLQGGIHLVLQVETQEALKAEVSQVRDRIEANFKDNQVPFRQIVVTPDLTIRVEGVPLDRQTDAEREMDNSAFNWQRKAAPAGPSIDYSLELMAAARRDLLQLTVRQVREVVQNRIDQFGVSEPTVQVYGSGEVPDQIIVELPGVEDFDRIINILKRTATLELRLVHPTLQAPYETREQALAALGNAPTSEYEVLPYRDRDETGSRTQYMVVRKAAAITGQHLKNARRAEDNFTGRSEVLFFLNTEGVRLFSDVTGRNVNKRLAIVLDGEIRSAPNIESKITTESARITGSFTPEQAQDLALVLRSGALPAPIRILENRSVGPSLGLDSIRSGVSASILGMVLVVLAMLLFYRWSGMNAVACLMVNLVILLGVLAAFGATLTLPGIAGVILTIGMAVDANILIFERIKEELRLGKTVRSAVEAGFGRVFGTIIDTNTTTLIAALFLFQFGTGPVRGFAVTLITGLVANVFTATFASRAIFAAFLQKREVTRLSI